MQRLLKWHESFMSWGMALSSILDIGLRAVGISKAVRGQEQGEERQKSKRLWTQMVISEWGIETKDSPVLHDRQMEPRLKAWAKKKNVWVRVIQLDIRSPFSKSRTTESQKNPALLMFPWKWGHFNVTQWEYNLPFPFSQNNAALTNFCEAS